MSLDDQNAFQQSFEFILSPGTVGDGPIFTVPAAKRLVIEQVSFASGLPPGGKAEHYIVFTTVNGVNGFYHFNPGDNQDPVYYSAGANLCRLSNGRTAISGICC
jgi:hypothetical protein